MKTVKAKISVLILVLALVFTMIPSVIFADGEEVTEYDLYVGGVRVTSENANDVLSDGGTVKYDSEDGVLTLSNANINMGFVDHGNRADHYSGVSYFSNAKELKIKLEGRNTISGNTYGRFGMGMFILEHTQLVFGGNGELDIDVPNIYEETYGICTLEDTNTIFGEQADVNIFSGGIGIETKNITIREQSKVKVDAEGTGVKMGEYSYSLEKGILNVQDYGIFEVNTAGVDSKAFERIDTELGNVKDIKASVGQSRVDVQTEPWEGDTESIKLTDYKFVRFPYEVIPGRYVYFNRGDHGEGTMDEISVNKGGRFTLPKCDFTGLDNYGFYRWEIEGQYYRPGDRVTIDHQTTVTATWVFAPIDLFIGGVQVNADNQDDVFGDGTVSVAIAKSPGDRPGEIIVKLKNATIECDRQDDGDNANTEFGINYKNQGKDLLRIILEGENKIVNKKTYAGIIQVEGIQVSNAEETIVEGDGTLDVEFNSARKDGKYFGIHTYQQTTIDRSKVNINIYGDYFSADSFDVKGFYLQSNQPVNLRNKSELMIHTDNRYAFDNNTQNNVDIDVEEGSIFQATCKFFRTWGALHGNNWVGLSGQSKAQGVVVSKRAKDEKLIIWDGTTDLGTYQYVRVPNDQVEPETTTVPETTKKPTPNVKKPDKVKVIKAKRKSSKKIQVKLKKTKRAKGYQVAVYKSKKKAKKNRGALVKKTYKKTTFTIKSKKFKKKKKLYVKARAYNFKTGKKKQYGKWSNVKKVKKK